MLQYDWLNNGKPMAHTPSVTHCMTMNGALDGVLQIVYTLTVSGSRRTNTNFD